jgi:hypothetical protein
MTKTKLIFIIISGIVLAFLIFYSGLLLGQRQAASEKGTTYSYFTQLQGFGKIKDIAPDGSTITIVPQTVAAATFEIKANIISDSKFFKIDLEKNNGNNEFEAEDTGVADLEAGMDVFYVIKPVGESGFDLYWLNIEKE